MERNKAQFLCEKYAKQIPHDMMKDFANRLLAAPDDAFEPLVNAKLKSRTTAILLSIFLGGFAAGKFYVGEIKAAVIKIVVTFVLGVVGGLMSLLWAPLYLFASVPVFIWWIVDIVRIGSYADSANVQKLYAILFAFSK